jgi:hypothetical protein
MFFTWFHGLGTVRVVIVSKLYLLDDAFDLKFHCNTFEVDYEIMLCVQFHGLRIVHMVVVSRAYYLPIQSLIVELLQGDYEIVLCAWFHGFRRAIVSRAYYLDAYYCTFLHIYVVMLQQLSQFVHILVLILHHEKKGGS